MKAFKTVFLIIEMVIGFGIPVYMWVFGVIMSPIIVLGVFTGGGIEMAAPLMAEPLTANAVLACYGSVMGPIAYMAIREAGCLSL